jgi:predicted PurR-regulated permease PerM
VAVGTAASDLRVVLSVLVTLPIVALFLWMVRPVSVPILLAGLFAILFTPVDDWLRKKLSKHARWAPGIVTTAAVIGVIGPLSGVVAYAVTAAQSIKTSGVEESAQSTLEGVIHLLRRIAKPLRAVGIDVSHDGIEGRVHDTIASSIDRLGKLAGDVAASMPNAIVATFLFVIALYFFLRDGRALLDWLEDVLPFRPEDVRHLRQGVRVAVHGVMLGELLTGIVQSVVCVIFLAALRVPGAFLWSVIAFVLSFVPLFGTAPVTLGATIYLFASGRIVAGIIMAVGVVVIGSVDNVTRPLANAAKGKMHPLLALASIFGGLAAIGPAGVFLGPVIATMAIWSLELLGSRRPSQKSHMSY